MSHVYKTLVELQEEAEALDNITTEKKNQIAGDSLESLETRRMNNQEVEKFSSPKSENLLSHQMETESESNYDSIADENDE